MCQDTQYVHQKIRLTTRSISRLINISHEGHQSIVKTKQLLRYAVWFLVKDRMTQDIVRSSLPCQAATQQRPNGPLQMTELPERPLQKTSLDFSGPYPSWEYCLLVVVPTPLENIVC